MRHLNDHIEIFACPSCGGHLQANSDKVECNDCLHQFAVEANIPLLFWPGEKHDPKENVTDIVKSFYEKTPFYDQRVGLYPVGMVDDPQVAGALPTD